MSTAVGSFFNEIDPDFRTEIIDGLVGNMESMFLQVFRPQTVNQESGSVPYIPSKFTLGDEDDNSSSRIAINAEPDMLDSELSSAAFRFSEKYSKGGSIGKSKVVASRDFDSPEKLLNHILTMPMTQIAKDLDKDGATILQSASLNDTVSATAAWSDSSNARPVTDLDSLFDNGGDSYDLLWLGESEYRELAALPALVSFANNYSAVDARAPKQLVSNWLMARYTGLTDVVIEGAWFNNENPAQTISTSRQFDGTVWAGKKDHMLTIELADMREVEEGYNPKAQVFYAFAHVWIEMIRAEKKMGCALTGF